MLKLLSTILIAVFAFGAILTESVHTSAAPALTARTSDEAGVRVVVTPKMLERGAKVWEFTVVMDTHVKPLNDDLVQAAALVNGAGGRIAPSAWQGDSPGGHHRKGVLQFPPPTEMPKFIELQINGVGGVATRTFRWEVE